MKVNVGYFSKENDCTEWEIEEEEMAQSLARALKALRKYRKYSLKNLNFQSNPVYRDKEIMQ